MRRQNKNEKGEIRMTKKWKLIFWYVMLCLYLIIPYLAILWCALHGNTNLLALGNFPIVWLISLIPLGIIGSYLDKLWKGEN